MFTKLIWTSRDKYVNVDTLVDIKVGDLGIFTESQMKCLIQNALSHGVDHIPVAYLRQADMGYHWLVTEIDLDNELRCYGLHNYPDFNPKIGYFNLMPILELNSTDNKVLNHPGFGTSDKLSLFYDVCQELGYITVKEELHTSIFEKLRQP